MHTRIFDVAIIGAGPSGSTLAYYLKKNNPNLSVGLFDKAVFPRYKPCGGGISTDIYNYLDFSLNEVTSCLSSDITIIAGEIEITPSPEHQIIMVRRELFDEFLVNKAKEFGAETYLGSEVVDLRLFNSLWQLSIKDHNQPLRAKICVLAEGSRGKLAKKLGVAPKNQVYAAIEYEHNEPLSQAKTFINFDYIEKGYAWNFPKNNGQSIGIGGLLKGVKKENESLAQKLKNYALNFDIEVFDKNFLHGHPIQFYSGYNKLAHEQLLLVGEISGCVDPLTGEGIRPAIKTAFLAAKLISEAFKKKDFSVLQQYNNEFHQQIGKDYRYARFLTYLVHRHADSLLNQQTAQSILSVFSGRKSYKEITLVHLILGIKRMLGWRGQKIN